MPKTQGHLQIRIRRAYRGEAHGLFLVRFLNRDERVCAGVTRKGRYLPLPSRAALRRVEEFLNRLRAATHEFNSMLEDGTAPGAAGKECMRLAKWLERYGRFRLEPAPQTDDGQSGYIMPMYIPAGRSFNESRAIESVWELSQQRVLDRLRLCAWCKKYFFARFEHQTHCNSECRKKEVAQSPKWKQYRKEKSKQYYWDRKSGRKRRSQ